MDILGKGVQAAPPNRLYHVDPVFRESVSELKSKLKKGTQKSTTIGQQRKHMAPDLRTSITSVLPGPTRRV